MNKNENWNATDISKAKSLPYFEFKTNKRDWVYFEILYTDERIFFGNASNAVFLESGYIERDYCESLDETLREMIKDLECYYNDGPGFTNRIVCNERM